MDKKANHKSSKPSRKIFFIFPCIAIIIILLAILIRGYYQPKHYSGSITLKTLQLETTLNIQMDIYAHRSLFRPTKFSGKLIVNDREYVSCYTKDIPKRSFKYDIFSSIAQFDLTSYSRQYDENNFFENLIAKLRGEQQIPAFLLPESKDPRYGFFIENLQEVFSGKNLDECNLIVHTANEETKITDHAMTKYAYELYLKQIESFQSENISPEQEEESDN